MFPYLFPLASPPSHPPYPTPSRWSQSTELRNEIELFVVRWMELESVIQSEVSQKEKNKYGMLTHIYGI